MFANAADLFFFLSCSENLGTDCPQSPGLTRKPCIQILGGKKSFNFRTVFTCPTTVPYVRVQLGRMCPGKREAWPNTFFLSASL